MSTPIETTVRDAQRVLNRGVLRRAACLGLLAGGGVALAGGLAFAATGHRVSLWVYPAGAGVGLAVAAGAYGFGRVSAEAAARRLDERFGLSDGVSAARSFEAGHATGGVYALQRRWAESRLAGVSVAALRPKLSRALLIAALTVPTVSVLLGFRPPAPAVVAAEREAAATLALGESLNQGIRDEVEKLLKDADEREKEALDPEGLRELAEKLGVSEERADLMRQYAAMEQELATRAAALEQTHNESLLDDAAAGLAGNPSTSALAEALRQKDYQRAADLLDGMQPDPDASLADQAKQAEKLKAATGQLAAAARRQSQRSGGSTGEASNSLGTLSENLDARASELSRTLQEAAKKAGRESELDPELQKKLGECRGACEGAGEKLSEGLSKAGACRSAGLKLNFLRQTLSQCQGACSGQGSNPFGQGSKGIGAGTADSPTNALTRSDGQLDAITGQKAAGPSEVQVEDAASGTGVSSRRTTPAPGADHARQLESFVDRPDVPDAMKQGVKTYFETLHGTDVEAN